jgi:hypothetical protein
VVSPSPSISGVSAINPVVAFYDIHGRKREVLLFYLVPDTTHDTFTKKILVCIYPLSRIHNTNITSVYFRLVLLVVVVLVVVVLLVSVSI